MGAQGNWTAGHYVDCVDCSLATYSGVELAVPKNRMLPVPSGNKGLSMPDARGQCQAVGADHGELSWSTLRNNAWPMIFSWWPAYRAVDGFHCMHYPNPIQTSDSDIWFRHPIQTSDSDNGFQHWVHTLSLNKGGPPLDGRCLEVTPWKIPKTHSCLRVIKRKMNSSHILLYELIRVKTIVALKQLGLTQFFGITCRLWNVSRVGDMIT